MGNFLNTNGLTYFWDKIKSNFAKKAETYTKAETDTKITEKVAEIVADAPEDFDTLKEMSDWISSHEEDASAMNSAILANTSAISGKVDKVTGKGLSTEDFTTAEKSKLAGLENYALPIASADTLGGVKIGDGLSIADGVLSTSGGLGNLKIAYGKQNLETTRQIDYSSAGFTSVPVVVASINGSLDSGTDNALTIHDATTSGATISAKRGGCNGYTWNDYSGNVFWIAIGT